MSNSIILFSSLFGSVYLMSVSLGLINKTLLNKNTPRKIIIINGLTFVFSATIFIHGHGFTLLDIPYFIKLR